MKWPARRLLVPDDFTEASAAAWAWAQKLSAADARRTSLVVYDAPSSGVLGLPSPPASKSARRRLLGRMRLRRPDATQEMLDEGDAVRAILHRAQRSDLVVLGAHARGAVARLALGSVSAAVARDCACPVLTVQSTPGEVRSILAPVIAKPYAHKGLRLAAETAVYLGAELVLFHAGAPGASEGNSRFWMNAMLAKLPQSLREATPCRLVVRAGNPIEEILREAPRHGLVVMAAHRKSLLSDWVLGTTIERVLRHCSVPVLSAPA
jgi:nucleotide-binding universal stress UspA family protein